MLAVLYGLAAGWAAVDLGSALLVVALIVTAAVIARARVRKPELPDRLTVRSPFARLVWATIIVVYGVLVSGVLVAGKNSLTGCLGWPMCSAQVVQMDLQGPGNILRLFFAVVGLILIVAVFVQAWRGYRGKPAVFRSACWAGAAFLFEVLVQGLMLVLGFTVPLMIVYTVTMAAFWGLLLVLGANVGLEADPG